MKPPKLFLILLLFLSVNVSAQNTFRVVFYNVENLFDTEDNPKKNDNEFLPEGTRRWTPGKYYNKINNLGKVISSIGEWSYPAIIGLCEIENEKVLKDLTSVTVLRKAQYRFIITDSPDERGINTALLYQRDQFKYLHHKTYNIKFPNNPRKFTRDILHVTGEVVSGDSLDIFVCHFPSRRGGAEQSEPDRMFVAGIVKSRIDSLKQIRSDPNILVMGDFNDEPSDKSLSLVLQAKSIDQEIDSDSLYNLFAHFEKRRNEGSYKFGRYWNMLDQIIVSGNLLQSGNCSFYALPYSATIFRRDYMTTKDKTHGGERPKKTFHGYRHEGGFSDHFPIFVDFNFE